MYIGQASLQNLRAFLAGYEFGISQTSISVPEEIPDFAGFHDWVANKLGYGESTSGWNGMIASQRVDPEEAVYLFFQLLDEYRGLHPRALAEAILDLDVPPTLSYFINPRGWKNTEYVRPIPTSVVIEEVLPTREWVALTVRKDDIILGVRGFDNMQKAMEGAEEFLSIPQQEWKLLLI